MQQTITIIVAVAVFLVDATQYNARETGVVGLAAEGKLDVATTLLEHNADPNQARAADGMSLRHDATMRSGLQNSSSSTATEYF